MSRLMTVFCVLALLVASVYPVTAVALAPEGSPPAETAGLRLNSEGDEWVWYDPAQAEPQPLTLPSVVQNETNQPVPTSLLPDSSAVHIKTETELALALDRARNGGPQAVLDFVAAHPQSQHPLLQAALLDAQLELHPPVSAQPHAPAAPVVSLNSGPCVYETIQAAINAATNGDTVRISAGAYVESLDISAKTITVQGGYDATCSTFTGGTTTITAATSGSVVDFSTAAVVSLRDLRLTGGTSFGAGVDLLGSSHVTLDNADIFNNNGASGAGGYIGGGSVLTYTNDSDIYDNTSSSSGGGFIVYGGLYGYVSASDIDSNAAVTGGGIAVYGGTVRLDNADVVGNTATTNGGGLFISEGTVTLRNSVFVGETVPIGQGAAAGGGIYAYASQVNLLGASTTVMNNTATTNGGGIYLTNGSELVVTGGYLGYDSAASAGNDAVLGAGMYTISSTVTYSGQIINNIATNSGGGIYANQSTLAFDAATIGGIDNNTHNQIGASGLNGAGLYLINGTRAEFDETTIISNTLSNASTGYAGGLYVRAGSVVSMTNSSVEQHYLPSTFDGRGAGFYIYDSTVTLTNTQVTDNTAGDLGGGARLFGTSTLNIRDGSSFSNNHAADGVGGAIAATNSADINVSNAIFQDNSASTHGGAIYLDSGSLDFTGAWDVRFNTAGGNGGAVAIIGSGNAGFRVTGGALTSFLAVNHAGGSGGAVYTANTNAVELYATSGYRLNLNSNSAAVNGGALYADAGAIFDVYGDVVATTNNTPGNGGFAYLAGGSRIWLDDYATTPVQVLVNTAANGGAIYALNSPRVECDGSIFGFTNNGNKALTGSGGAIYLSSSTLDADNCIFRNNQAQAGDGGAIAAYTSDVKLDVDYPSPFLTTQVERPAGVTAPLATACNPVTQECNSLYLNTASNNGGAIFSSGSDLVLNSGILHRNTAQRGGALYQEGAAATGVISNTLVYSNTSILSFGAGVRVSGGAMTVWHGTFANNTGGAGYSPGSAQSYIYNSIIWGNSVAAFGSLTEAECNIDQGGTAGPATNPDFLNPGAGEDYRLALGSPAVDACLTGLPIDLINTARPQDFGYDMGAYEAAYTRVFMPVMRK